MNQSHSCLEYMLSSFLKHTQGIKSFMYSSGTINLAHLTEFLAIHQIHLRFQLIHQRILNKLTKIHLARFTLTLARCRSLLEFRLAIS
jgi:hypothetical protein